MMRPQDMPSQCNVEPPPTREEALEDCLRAILRFGEHINIRVDHGMLSYTGGKKPATKDMFAFPRWHLTDIEAALAMPKDSHD